MEQIFSEKYTEFYSHIHLQLTFLPSTLIGLLERFLRATWRTARSWKIVNQFNRIIRTISFILYSSTRTPGKKYLLVITWNFGNNKNQQFWIISQHFNKAIFHKFWNISHLINAIHPFQLSSWNDWNVQETRHNRLYQIADVCETDQMEKFHIVLTLI